MKILRLQCKGRDLKNCHSIPFDMGYENEIRLVPLPLIKLASGSASVRKDKMDECIPRSN